MKINFKFLLAAALLVGTGSAFASAVKPAPARIIDTEDRKVADFKGISLSGSFDYYIKQGSSNTVRVEAPAKILSYIVTEVKNGVLNVYTKNNTSWTSLFNSEKVAVYITAKDINSIQLSGSGDVFFHEGIKSADLRISLSGSGDITGKITATSVDCSLTGSGDIRLSGRAENAKVKVVGSGDFTAAELQTNNTYVEVIGSGDARVNATGSLNAKVSGSGDIRYRGNPKSINKSKSGSGDIDKG
ncbi:head GIN domain-containing protein [Mucilaginibacter calamicampi]|uniref:Head GIN domain-containing protein n=1 Tax=Mucilaginibacter calamicampi TaxID=1302352 RepID=A0ABW2YTP1_9SPHI